MIEQDATSTRNSEIIVVLVIREWCQTRLWVKIDDVIEALTYCKNIRKRKLYLISGQQDIFYLLISFHHI